MNKIKVAIFTGNYNHIQDGVSLTLNRLVSFLLKKDVDVLVFGPTISKPDLDHVGTLIPVPSLSMPGRPEYRFTTAFPKSARKKLEEFNPDIVHLATPDILGLKALKWALKNDKPIVSSYHTHFSSYLKYYKLTLLEPLMWKYLCWFYSKCVQVYVPSPSMAKILEQLKVKSELKIWARGIDNDLFNPKKRSLKWRRKHGIRDDEIVVTFISRLVWEKNLELYAEIMKKILSNYKNVKAMIVGNGPAEDGIRELLPNAIYTGFLSGEELAKSYASSDIFFFPSDTETFGNVTLEAMASGLPCVVAMATGSSSLIEHNKNGFLASVDKPKEFEESLEKLINAQDLRERMAQISLDKAQKFSWDLINSNLLNNYLEVLEGQKLKG